MRRFSLFSQTWRFLFDHLLIVAALGPEPVPLICKSHCSITWDTVRFKQCGWMWCIGTYVLSYLPSLLPFMQGWIAKDAAVTQSSSAPAAFAGCLYDVHQQSICRPKDPGNGDSTTIGFNWRCKGLAAYCNRAKKWPKNVFTGLCLEDSRRPRWRAQLSRGSNWDSLPPGQGPGLAAVEHTRRLHLNSRVP